MKRQNGIGIGQDENIWRWK